MEFNGIVNMLSRLFLRKAITKGVDMATRAASKPGSGSPATPAQNAQARAAREAAKRARKAAQLTRRLGR